MDKGKICLGLDNEGPLTLGDNAQESTVGLADNFGLGEEVGVKFFRQISNIDDIWGDFRKLLMDPTYSSGHTLKVILPFFRAMGATSEWLEDYAYAKLRVVPRVENVLPNLDRKYHVRQISTSYEFYIRAFCKLVGFDFTKAHCTRVSGFDGIPISAKETFLLLNFMEEVAEMPVIEYDGKTGEVIPEHQEHYERITSFIWGYVYGIPAGRLLRDVRPVGQTQKREALESICAEAGVSRERTMYVGDSQTDVQCVEYLRGQGLTMMFNGKGRVCEIADLMYIGEDARAIEEVADLFAEERRAGVIDYYTPAREAKNGGTIAAVTSENFAELHAKSVENRIRFRGVHIGALT